MNISERTLALAVAAGVWLAGFGVAGAVGYKLVGPRAFTSAYVAPRTAQVGDPVDAMLEAPVTLELDTVWLFGQRPHFAPTAAEPKPNVARDISEMTCTGWRDLEAGSGHVQLCE